MKNTKSTSYPLIVFMFLLSVCSSNLQANIIRSSVNQVGVGLYGVYMTKDPSCQTGLMSAVFLSRTASSIDFAKAPNLTTATVPAKIGCVVLIVKNQIQLGLKNLNFSGNDSVCTGVGSVTTNVCTQQSQISWPSQIQQDAQTQGLSLATSCGASPTGNEVVPIYLSINSKCSGSSNADSANSSCVSASGLSTTKVSQAPGTSGSTTSGVNLSLPIVKGRLVIVVDPHLVVSGTGGTCQASSLPLFSMHQ